MKMIRTLRAAFTSVVAEDNASPSVEHVEKSYDSPLLVDLGRVRDVTLGNSSSGRGDANSQYYW
jgi:hypothetical protein